MCALPFMIAAILFMILPGLGVFDRWFLEVGTGDALAFPETGSPHLDGGVQFAAIDAPSLSTVPREDGVLVHTMHRIARGETISRIALNYGLSPITLVNANRLEDPSMLRVGTHLLIPYADGIRVTVPSREDMAQIAQRFKVDADAVNRFPGTTNEFFITGIVPEASSLPTSLGDSFLYPVQGRIITPFGQVVDNLTGIGYQSDGLDFMADAGSPVNASRSGTVILTGTHPSYGRYVMLSHPGGWKSFYGHLSSSSVSVGDRVSQGERLGAVGQTGSARTPRLHFILMRGEQVVNPLDHLL